MIRLTHLCFQHIEMCYTLSSFSINNDELIEFSPLTSRSLLLTRCDVRQCAHTFLLFLSPAISIVLYVMRVYLLYLKKSFGLLNNTKLLFYSDDYRSDDPLIHFNHTTKIIIINMSSLHTQIHAFSYTYKMYLTIYMDKRRRNAYK
jgi:hypothetical protein